MKKHTNLLLFSLLFASSLLGTTQADAAVGIYGVHDIRLTQNPEVDFVFVKPDPHLIDPYRATGKEVFLTLNVFGGRMGWEQFPDSNPVTASGKKLEDNYGGICPTHAQWRQSRLDLLAAWVREFGGNSGISGVWLDYIRYPGSWEHATPGIPDCCYCARCLESFQKEKEVEIPGDLKTTEEKSAWINEHVPLLWMEWKKRQVTSFVKDARNILDANPHGKKLKLGVFLVPWRKSDFNGALSFQIAQDAASFQPFVDVYSPMVYHRMVGRNTDWIGQITAYYREMVAGEIWPIVQADEISGDEFEEVIRSAAKHNGDRIIVYKQDDMKDDQWHRLNAFTPPKNMIPNPEFELVKTKGSDPDGEIVNLLHWQTGDNGTILDSRFLVNSARTVSNGESSIGITAGQDRQGVWRVPVETCKPGGWYRFSAEFYRENRYDSHAYPYVKIWGKNYRLNTHRVYGKFQNIQMEFECDTEKEGNDEEFAFINNYPGTTFWMRSPRLQRIEKPNETFSPPVTDDFFPVGIYGGRKENLAQIKALGLNSAVIRLNEENVKLCSGTGMHCTVAVPRSPEKLLVALNGLETDLRDGRFSFYVNDEPGIHSFPIWKADDIQQILKEKFPDKPTGMAIVRPQVIQNYRNSSDYFMLDQYPVPNMPMSWPADSMDEAALHVDSARLQSVVQAFGGGRFARSGWDRKPSFEEMNNLAFLSIIHGSRGIYFYTWPEITATDEGKRDLEHVVKRLNSLRSWLVQKNDPSPVKITMLTKYRVDPSGNPAVHCTSKTNYGTRMMICANTLRTYTEADVFPPDGSTDVWQDYFGEAQVLKVDETLRLGFDPLEVKVLMEAR